MFVLSACYFEASVRDKQNRVLLATRMGFLLQDWKRTCHR